MIGKFETAYALCFLKICQLYTLTDKCLACLLSPNILNINDNNRNNNIINNINNDSDNNSDNNKLVL